MVQEGKARGFGRMIAEYLALRVDRQVGPRGDVRGGRALPCVRQLRAGLSRASDRPFGDRLGAAAAAVEAAAAAALSVPGPIMVLGYIAALIALMVLGSRLQFAGLEPPLFALESIPGVRRTIAHSWTARFPRYGCQGFRPAQEERSPPRLRPTAGAGQHLS